MAEFGQLLHNLNKVGVFDVKPSAVADNDKGWPELLDLVDEEIFENL